MYRSHKWDGLRQRLIRPIEEHLLNRRLGSAIKIGAEPVYWSGLVRALLRRAYEHSLGVRVLPSPSRVFNPEMGAVKW